MAANITKKSRANTIDSLQKLIDGLNKHASTAPSVMLAGVTLRPSDVAAKLQALIAEFNAATTAATAWHNQVMTERNAAQQTKPLLLLVRRTLEAAYASQLDVLADFGLTPRKKTVISPQTRAAAAAKAKATRAARGSMGRKQRSAITAPVVVTPTSASPIKSVTTASGTTTSLTAIPATTGASNAVVGAGAGAGATVGTPTGTPAAAPSTSPPPTAVSVPAAVSAPASATHS
jgi:hypothetical protein